MAFPLHPFKPYLLKSLRSYDREQFSADLIVVGTHNRTGLDRLIMGSVAENVVRHAQVPVLVIPFKEE